MQLIEIIQQLIYSLALALLMVYLSTLPRRSLFLSSMLFMLLILLENFIPLYRGSSLVEIVRGAIGDVSLASGGLLVGIIVNQFDFSEKKTAVLHRFERIGLFLMGLILYLSYFGFISGDIYHYGYLSSFMVIALTGLVLLLILANRLLGYVWLFALVGFYWHWQASNNLWDYIYDPLLWLVLGIENLAQLLVAVRTRYHASTANW